MINEISKCEFFTSQDNIFLNPEYFKKKRFTGLITKGIYSNMVYAINNFEFKYFIILSSRNMFYNKLNKENYNFLPTNCKHVMKGKTIKDLEIKSWHWPSFLKTKLSKYIKENNLLFSSSPHEGLTFDYISCQKIIDFLNNSVHIKNDLFNWKGCIEEFALQTICINLTGYYYYIGNGWDTNHDINNLPTKDRKSNTSELQ